MQIFPILHRMSSYKRKDLPKDIIGGLTVGIVLIPQAMAYAMIAGLPPVYGLYASLMPLLVYAFFGTSRSLAIGPVAMDSLLVAIGLGALAIIGLENYIAMAILLAFMVGAIQLVLGIFRMGYLVTFLAKPVISGFTSAAAMIIIFSQLKHLLGVEMEGSNQFHRIFLNAIKTIPETNFYDFIIGLSGILLLIGFKKWNRQIPAILIIVVLGILAVYFFKMESLGIEIVGTIPKGLPGFALPTFSLDAMMSLWPIALTLALIGYLEAISIGKSIEEKNEEDQINANQELIALGSANMLGSFFQSFPVAASFSRSAIDYESGSKSTLSGIFTVFLVIVTLLFLTPLFYYLPKAILASIIMVSVFGLIDLAYAKRLWTYRKDEFIVLVFTFLLTLFIGITQGILTGVLLSLLLMVYRTSKPHFAVIAKLKDSEYYKNITRFGDEVIMRDDLLIVRFDSQLYFGNSDYFKNQLYKYIDKKGDNLKGVILNAEAINYIDSTATRMLTKVIKKIRQDGVQFYIAGAIGPTRDIIFRSGISDVLPKEFLFVKIKEAVAHFDNPENVSATHERVAYQRNKKGN
ncbi:SulP family inorganic anion transporter [uncultured Eudoraea sp.]|uniref:SulP family inorganic anion transporter n=1 Tax=uncultured Eudoraea sp. TaxID=1035614 RepID=UPI00261AED7D|nr:solute carrier family 26 protein [uncultured Eudoraea sp.]